MKSVIRSVKHVKYVLGSMSAVLFINRRRTHLLVAPAYPAPPQLRRRRPGTSSHGEPMFETGVRQVRMAVGMVSGRRLSTRNLARLVDDALATLAEFGEPGDDAQRCSAPAS